MYGVRRPSADRPSSMSSHPPLSPSDSCISIGAFRPSLVWLFNHIRQENKENLSKDDLRVLLGATVDNSQLDEAFEHLDLDKDGEISLDEFIAGFAKFWKEAPHTPGYEQIPRFSFPPREVSPRHSAAMVEEESFENDVSETSPSERLKESLVALSSHNRHSIESLWESLSQTNPDLLTDFEEFVAEVAGEVQVAQRALNNQRLAIKKEACELDEEIESRLNDAQTTLHIQTNLVKQQVRDKLEYRLSEKEGELMVVRNQLDELEEEVQGTQRVHNELQTQYQALHQEKVELHERLQESEKRLLETQSTVANIKSKALTDVEAQQVYLGHHEEELLKQKKEYEESIAKLKEQLALHAQTSPTENESPQFSNEATPDLLATSRPRAPSRGSLRDEIVQKEGMASPLLRGEQLLEPSPFRDRSRSFITKRPVKKQPTKSLAQQSVLTMSLPNLADIDELGNVATSKQAVYIPVYVGTEDRKTPDIPAGHVTRDQSHVTSSNEIEDESTPTEDHVTITNGHVTTMDPVEGAMSDDSVSVASSESESLPSLPEHPLQSLKDQQYQQCCQPIEFIDALATSPDYVFKILVVGNSFVGKSSYLFRMCNNAFSQRYSSTVGVDFYSKALRTEDKKIVSLQLWDTAGQERFRSVTKAYYRGAQGVVLMYDISQEESFLSVKSWINSIHDNTDHPPAAMILVGNKVDLEDSGEREVLTETGENFAKMYGAEFIETSAKTGYNVANSLLMLVRAIKDHYDQAATPSSGKKMELFEQEQKTHVVQLSGKETNKPSDSGCFCTR